MHDWKSCVGETLPRVRIPISPPLTGAKKFFAPVFFMPLYSHGGRRTLIPCLYVSAGGFTGHSLSLLLLFIILLFVSLVLAYLLITLRLRPSFSYFT